MQVGITNPLREFLGWRPFTPWAVEEDPLFCWDAHRVKIDGRVMLVVCNAANRFAAITAMRAADWKRLAETCMHAIAQAMLSAGFSAEAVDAYLALAEDVEYGRTHGRVAVACMNRMIDKLLWYQCDHDNQFQHFLCHVANADDIGSCAAHDGYGMAAERMADDLVSHGINPFGPQPAYGLGDTRSAADPVGATGGAGFDGPDYSILPEHLIEYGVAAAKQNRNDAQSDELAEIDGRIADVADDEEARYREGEAALKRAKKEMLEARGLASTREDLGGCCICADEVRVYLGNEPYCLDCFNELVERMHGLPHVTNDTSTIVVFDAEGETVQFAVERLVTPLGAQWTAHEIVDADDPRRATGYDGIEVHTYVDPRADQDEALAELWEKAQQALSNPSTHEASWPKGPIANGAHVAGKTLFANDVGWGRIEDVPGYCIIIDGQRFTGTEFLALLSNHVGFNLQWRIVDRSDPLPEFEAKDDGAGEGGE